MYFIGIEIHEQAIHPISLIFSLPTFNHLSNIIGYIDCVDHNKLWKTMKEMGIPDHLTCSWEICMQVRKQQLELDMEQQTGSK